MSAGVSDAAPRVLMTADAVGGVWTYALDLARGLASAGAQVTLAVLGPPPSADQREAAHAMPGVALRSLDGPLDWTASRESDLRPVAEALARLAGQMSADVVHLNSPALAALARFDAPVLGVCHSCTATWWTAVRGGALPQAFAWRRDLLARGYAACDALNAPSAAFAAATEALYGVRPEPIWNGRRPAPVRAHRRERFVLTAGRLWDEGKDLATLDRAAARLAWPVVALGHLDGPDGEAVRLDHIRTPGPQSAALTADWMASAPVFASAAVYEPFGLAVLEAAQVGCALVLSDIPTFRELWDGAAVFVPARDADGFAAAIDGLLTGVDAREAMAAQAQARARRYTLEALVASTLAQYARLAPSTFAAEQARVEAAA